MTAYDTDVLPLLGYGHSDTVARIAAVPAADRWVPVVAVAEVLRSRLHVARQAEAGKGPVDPAAAYDLLAATLRDLGQFQVLPYTPAADALFAAWRAAKLRVGSQVLRIAAICVARGATLSTRNRRDYEQVVGLTLEVWP